MRRSLLACALVVVGTVVAALPPVLAADETPTPTPRPVGGLTFTDEVEVVVVNVDVYVRDGRGNPVRGLSRDDFRVLQDGTRMPISHFVELNDEVFRQLFAPALGLPGPTPTPTITDLPEIQPVFMVLYVDHENIEPLNRNRVLRRVREFIDSSLQPPMQVMVVSHLASLKVVQPFTDDPAEVKRALRGMQRVTGGLVERENARRELSARIREEQDRMKQYTTGSGESVHRRLRQDVLQWAEEEANTLAFSLRALHQVMGMLAGLDGRKSLVYVSDGLPMVPGIGLMHDYASVFHDNTILSQRSRFDRMRNFKSLTSAASSQDVVIYAIDGRGLQVDSGGSAEDRYDRDPLATSIGRNNYQGSLRYLANNTGGLATTNTNDITGGLERIRDDLFTYYSIGYTVSTSGRDRVHRIEVELPNHRGHDLRYRRRFVEKSLESRVQDRVMTALLLDVEDNPMEVEVHIREAAPAAEDRWTVPVQITVPLSRLALVPELEEMVGRVVLFVAARAENGKQSDLQRQEHELRFPAAEVEHPADRRVTIDVPFLMEEGMYRVAVGIMDQVTRQASYERIHLTVP